MNARTRSGPHLRQVRDARAKQEARDAKAKARKEEKRAAHELVERALQISRRIRPLQLITGCSVIRNKPSVYALAALDRFVRHAPADVSERERYTLTESLHGCIRVLRRGRISLRPLAFQAGLELAAKVLTAVYVADRIGMSPIKRRWNDEVLPPDDDDLDDDDTQPTMLTAIAVMVEASRALRRGTLHEVPPAESWAFVGIGGEDIRDYAPGLAHGNTQAQEMK